MAPSSPALGLASLALLLQPFPTSAYLVGPPRGHIASRRHQPLFSCNNPNTDAPAAGTETERLLGTEMEGATTRNNHSPTRRHFFASMASTSLVALGSSFPQSALAETRSAADAAVTDKIFIEFKGIPSADGSAAASSSVDQRIVIGLFGNDAPQPVSILKELVSKGGYKSKCKPLDTTRLLQKEQLEANKVYNACLENEDILGVNYDLSSVWRIIQDQRIDVGAVSGKFVARENPNFQDAKSGLTHDMAGVVSVRRGDDGGYGFTIFPGNKGKGSSDIGATILDEDNVVVGRVIEGMDVVERLNNLPVVKSAGVNYMALTGGPNAKNAPSRACRYGGPMYCNENKPLKKILIEKTGLL